MDLIYFPDLNIFINTDPKISIQKKSKNKKKENRFEKKVKIFIKCEAGFYNIAQKKKVVEFNGNSNEIDLHMKIIDYLNKKKFLTFFYPIH